jgi:hypothetical protein
MLMIPDITASSPTAATTDLNSGAAQQQAAEFDQLIAGIATAVLGIALEDMIKVANEDL